MHLNIITRGIKCDIDKMITQMQGKVLPYEYDGQPGALELIVSPIQLWSLHFPEPQLQAMMRMLWGKQQPTKRYEGLMMGALRKALLAKKMPDLIIDKNLPTIPLNKGATEIIPIGIKEDNFGEHGELV